MGGISGYHNNSSYHDGINIKNCYNMGLIQGSSSASSSIGGIVGKTWTKNTIENCYNTGDINLLERWICRRNSWLF